MAATTKLLNVTAYPLGIAGLVVVLPAVWGVRLYKALTMEPLDMKDKVVVVTGASSGIGEHMAYEYARLGARLGLVARRGEKLEEVAEEARLMGAPDVLVIEQDLGTEEGCKAAVDAALAHFKKIDTLALNAGMFHAYLFTDATDTKRFDSIMDVNFWGYVYMTYHALEHLQKNRGQIVVNSSVSSIVPQPRNSIYNASKAAVTNFFHTLRIELGDSVPITIFSPGVTKSELSDGKMSQAEGKVPGPEKARDLRNEQLGLYPIVPTAMMARDAVKAARYKKHDIILPVWYNMLGVYRALAPEVLDVGLRLWIVQDPPMAKRVIDTFNIKVGQPTKDQYEAGGFPKADKSEEDKSEEKQREKAGSRR
ncbi:short chain dehydrogenase reductase [Klebsormidium nitens]|uniref:Short chain dehydrogenase reductase n=1 Tax=Klebsormidium nitens TaxID=105231 RepID=A0A1Y1ITC7_KLENI|nr:short chain dehydrogenase reductase [Klebsormidium nitens]|eukprot:GAQ91438.1 short chain dehydrogenase reductase [Klebsormidium nitens]